MRTINTQWTVLVAALSLLGHGCSDLKDTIIVPEIQKEFYIDMREELHTGPSRLIFDVRTIDNEDCLNYGIDKTFGLWGGKMTLSLAGIIPPDECTPGQGPARVSINTGDLWQPVYDIDIDLQNAVFSEARLFVYSDRYSIEARSENGILFLHKLLRRVPAQAIWGYCAYSDAAQEITAQSILAQVAERSASAAYVDGFYGYFTITGQTVDVARAAGENGPIKPFLRQFDGDRVEMAAYMASLRAGLPVGMSLKVWTAKGEEW